MSRKKHFKLTAGQLGARFEICMQFWSKFAGTETKSPGFESHQKQMKKN